SCSSAEGSTDCASGKMNIVVPSALGNAPSPTGNGAAATMISRRSGSNRQNMTPQISPALPEGTWPGSAAAKACCRASINELTGKQYIKRGGGEMGWNMERGRLMTGRGRKWPSLGASFPASIARVIRHAEIAEGNGQFIGPRVASGTADR